MRKERNQTRRKEVFLMSAWEYSRDYRVGGLVVVRNEVRFITRVSADFGQQDSDWERSTVNY